MKKDKGFRLLWGIVIFALISTFVLFFGVIGTTLTRFQENRSGSELSRAATPRLYFIEGLSETSDYAPGETMVYTFAVTNQRNGEINEVALRYRLIFSLSGEDDFLPEVYYELYYRPEPQGDLVQLAVSDADKAVSSWINMGFDKAIVHSFELRLTWIGDIPAPEQAADRRFSLGIDTEVEQTE